MLAVAMLGNKFNVVAIGTYCHDSTLIATNNVVEIDPICCSDTWNSKLLIGIYGGNIGKLWFLVVGCTRSISSQYR
jgi:hypothetical protein